MAAATDIASQLSTSDYATQRKELLKLMSQLRGVGAQAELDLPRIVVIGNQSAGKSSVVEAISGIKVPRDSGTCTRSPIECRMATGPAWKCQISIRREFDQHGRRLAGDVSEERFGPALVEQNQGAVELMLRRAQLVVLDESVSVAEALRMDVDEVKERSVEEGAGVLKFSKNIVCVDLEGPELTDLQFIDLPGLIQNAAPQIVRLVQDMVVETIRGNCLILVAIPMSDDIENQIALRLAREQDPAGVRTIGVLTKPDVVPPGSNKRTDWLEVLEGRVTRKREHHALQHGYYCTRQPDDDERASGITAAQARASEALFFSTTAPWAGTIAKERFGTEHLVATLSTLLVEIIAERLPGIAQTAHAQLVNCRTALALLPKPSKEDPATRLLMLLSAFCSTVSQLVKGSAEPGLIVQKNNRAFAGFKRAIRSTAPPFVATIYRSDGYANVISSMSDDEDTGVQAVSQALYLCDVRAVLDAARARELPGDVPPAAKAVLIKQFQNDWAEYKDDCFDAVKDHVLDALCGVVERTEYFGRYAAFKGDIKIALSELVDKHAADCARYLDALLEMEEQPMTQNDHYLQATTEKWVAKYREQRAGKAKKATAKFDFKPVPTPKPVDPKPSSMELAPPTTAFAAPSPMFTASQTPTSAFGGAPPAASAFGASTPSAFGASTPSAFARAQPTTVPPAAASAFGSTPMFSSKAAFGGAPTAISQAQAPLGSAPAPISQPQPRAPESPFQTYYSRKARAGKGTRSPELPSEIPSASPAATPAPAAAPSPLPVPAPASSSPAPFPAMPHAFSAIFPLTPGDTGTADEKQKIQDALAALAAAGYTGLSAEDLGKLRPADEYEAEIVLMGGVRAYFQVSYKRVIDNIPGIIDTKFVKSLAKDLQANLIRRFVDLEKADTRDNCARYLTEDQGIVAKRTELALRLKMLEGVQRELQRFGR